MRSNNSDDENWFRFPVAERCMIHNDDV
jgi:hypothetical protein